MVHAKPEKRLRLPQVLDCTGYSRATLFRRIKAGEFPKARKDGAIAYWPESVVAEWQSAN